MPVVAGGADGAAVLTKRTQFSGVPPGAGETVGPILQNELFRHRSGRTWKMQSFPWIATGSSVFVRQAGEVNQSIAVALGRLADSLAYTPILDALRAAKAALPASET